MSSSSSNKSINSNRTITPNMLDAILKKAGLPKYVKAGRGKSQEGYVLTQSLDGLLTLCWEILVPSFTGVFDVASHTGRKLEECQKALREVGIESVLKASRLTIIYPDPECDSDFDYETSITTGEKGEGEGTVESDLNSLSGLMHKTNLHSNETGTPKSPPVFEVAHHKCPTCIFSQQTPISAPRFKEHLKQILATDGYAICHHAQLTLGKESQICCRGFFDAYGRDSLTTRLAKYLGIVKEVDL